MQKKLLFFIILVIFCSCSHVKVKQPDNFTYIQIKTTDFTLASWQKITDEIEPIKIYIEGDGNAYNSKGYPTNDPTPKNSLIQQIAFSDTSPNVIYLARPYQFTKEKGCNQKDWTTGRFSQKVIDNMFEAVKKISAGKKIFLIGYSGGALLTGLIINQHKNDLNIVKWVTIAGLFNHTDWTTKFDLLPLKDSLDLETLPDIEQIHFICKYDKTIPYELTIKRVNKADCIILEATHNDKKISQQVLEYLK